MKKLNLVVNGNENIKVQFYGLSALVDVEGEIFFFSYPIKDETNVIEGDEAIEMIKKRMLKNDHIKDVEIEGSVVIKTKEIIDPVWIKLPENFLSKLPQNMSFKALNSLRFNNKGIADSNEHFYSNLFLKFGTRIGEISNPISYIDDVLKDVDVYGENIDDQIIALLTEKYTTYIPMDDTFEKDVKERFSKAMSKSMEFRKDMFGDPKTTSL